MPRHAPPLRRQKTRGRRCPEPCYKSSKSSLLAQILGGAIGQLFRAGGTGGQEGSDGFAADFGDLVAVALRDLFDQSMGAQQPQLARDCCRALPLFAGRHWRLAEQQAPHVAVAQAIDEEFVATDRFE